MKINAARSVIQLQGLIGPIVACHWKGIPYLRSRPRKSNKTNKSEKVKEQRARFALASNFVSSINELIKISFKPVNEKMTNRNDAISYLLKNAVTGEYPDLRLEYSAVLVAKGDLPNAVMPVASSLIDGNILFTWANNAGTGAAKGKDKALLVVYCEEMHGVVFSVDNAERSTENAVFNVSSLQGKKVHTWIAFRSADGKNVSMSTYTGEREVM
jgi:hypothetical protein